MSEVNVACGYVVVHHVIIDLDSYRYDCVERDSIPSWHVVTWYRDINENKALRTTHGFDEKRMYSSTDKQWQHATLNL